MAEEDDRPEDGENGEAAEDGEEAADGEAKPKKPAPPPPPDVGAARAAYYAAATLKGHMQVENSLLGVYLMRLKNRPGSPPKQDDAPPPSSSLPQGLSMEERTEIAINEIKIISDQLNLYRWESERMLDELQSAYEEAQLRIGETRRDIGDFRREVMAEAAERGSRHANSELVLKFLQDRVKTTRFSIVKRKERNQTLHDYIEKAEDSLEGKKDLSEVLHAVDFDLLKIQKELLEGTLRNREQEVYKLKEVLARTEKAFDIAEAQLDALTEKYNSINTAITVRKPGLLRVKEDMAKCLETRAKAQDAYEQAVKDRDASSGEKKPSVMEYLELKQKVLDLQHMAHTMQMKVLVLVLSSLSGTTQHGVHTVLQTEITLCCVGGGGRANIHTTRYQTS